MTGRLLLVTILMVSAASVPARTAEPAGARERTTAEVDVKNGQALINGTAVDSDAAPIPNAIIRLRNLITKEVEQTLAADDQGEFTFVLRPDVPYVVEIADRAGRVLAVSDVVIVQTGDMAGLTLAIPGRAPAAAGLFGNTLASVLAAAAGTGITALDNPPLSPEK